MHPHGILILAHGTPSEEGTRAFLKFGELVASMAGETPVAVGFMEFASPNFAEGVAMLRQRGVARIAAVPVFLSIAGHTAHDLPPAVEQLRKSFPDMRITLTDHVGGHPKVTELSALRYSEALAGKSVVSAEETLVVLAAHGSPEPEAFEELERFAAKRRELTPVGCMVPCFSQLGSPLLKEVLPTLVNPIQLSASPSPKPSPPAPLPKGEGRTVFRRIVVQPHFLLSGRLVDSILRTTAAVAARHTEIDWIVTEPLGSHFLLAEAVLELSRLEGELTRSPSGRG